MREVNERFTRRELNLLMVLGNFGIFFFVEKEVYKKRRQTEADNEAKSGGIRSDVSNLYKALRMKLE